VDRASLVIIVSLLLVFVVAAAATWYVVNRNRSSLEGTPAASVFDVETGVYLDEAGNSVNLLPFTGEYLVVTSWASWSPFTEQDIRNLIRLSTEYPYEKVSFVAINRAEPVNQAKRGLINIPTDLAGLKIIYDPNDYYYKTIGGYAMPETVIFDRLGRVVSHERRQLSYEDLAQIIQSLLD
jgi:thiol-disulfide isomerase/thioredoxin